MTRYLFLTTQMTVTSLFSVYIMICSALAKLIGPFADGNCSLLQNAASELGALKNTNRQDRERFSGLVVGGPGTENGRQESQSV